MTHTDTQPRTKAELERELDQGWSSLEALLSELTEEEMTGPTDAQGWTVKDHLAHLAAWERSMVYLLEGKPRHEGLGVTEATYQGDIDDLNAAIRAASKDVPLDTVMKLLRTTHDTLREQVAAMSEDDLQQTYSHFLPDEPGKDDGRPILARISGNSGGHYAEHIPWMEAIVASR